VLSEHPTWWNSIHSKTVLKEMVRHWRWVCFLAPTLCFGCNGGLSNPELLPPGAEPVVVSTTRLPSTRLTVFSVRGGVDVETLKTYPIISRSWQDDGWRVKEWGTPLSHDEIVALTTFVTNQKTIYSDADGQGDQVRLLDGVLHDLRRWPASGVFVSWLYKYNIGSADYRYGDWVYFYYYNVASGVMIELTNAFR